MEKSSLTLRNYFEKNVNLFTILGIFNALAIYSASIDDSFISTAMSFIFSTLSIIVLNPIVKDLNDGEDYVDNSTTITAYLLKLSLIAAEFFLVIYILKKFYWLSLFVIFFYLLFFLINPLTKLISIPLIERFKIDTKTRPYSLKFQFINLLNTILSIALAIILTFIISHLIDFMMQPLTAK